MILKDGSLKDSLCLIQKRRQYNLKLSELTPKHLMWLNAAKHIYTRYTVFQASRIFSAKMPLPGGFYMFWSLGQHSV